MKSIKLAKKSMERDDISGNESEESRFGLVRTMFWRPGYLAPSAWHAHIPFAFWTMQAHRPRVVVELGVHFGVSYFTFCQAVSRLGLDTRCYGVDTFKGDVHSGVYDGSVYEQVKKHNDAQYSGFSTILRSTFDDALGYFENGSIDLLHIDGMHTLDAVRADFESWFRKLSPRAVVLMHDTNVRERGFGVAKFFQDLSAAYPHFEFIHGHGLGVLGIGKEQAEPMRRLFSLAAREPERGFVREAFATLGQGCADAFNAENNDKKAAGWMEQAETRDKQLKYLQQCLEKAKTEAEALQGELAEQKQAMHSERERLAREKGSLEGKLELLDSARIQLMAELGQRSSGVLGDQAPAEPDRQEMEALKNAIQDYEAKTEELENDRANAAVQLENAEQERGRLDEAIRKLSEEKGQLEFRIAGLEKSDRDLSEIIVLFQSENSRLKTELAEQSEQIARSGRLVEEAEQRSRTLSQEAVSSGNRIRQLERELSQEKAAAAHRDNLHTKTNQQLESLASANKKLLEEREAVQTQMKELRRELDSQAKQLDAARELEQLAARQTEEAQRIAHELKTQKEQLSERFAEIAELTKMLEEQTLKLKEKDHHAAIMASSITELKKRYEQAQQEITGLKNEVTAKTSGLEERFREIAMLTQLVQQREEEARSRDEELNFEKERAAHFRELLEAQTGTETAAPVAPDTGTEAKQPEPAAGTARKRKARVSRLSVNTQISLLEKSDILDKDWYLEQYADVAESGMKPAEHYVLYGAAEGRQPGPDFDTSWYVTNYPDVAETGVNPAVHYLKYGKKEGRATYSIKRG